jgi:pyrroline-5-carboxylate reductase
MDFPTIAIIGAGNMGECLIAGLLANQYSPDRIWAATPDENRVLSLKQKYSIHTSTDNLKAASKAEVLILAVKPHTLAEMVLSLRNIIQTRKPLVLSVVTGIKIPTIIKWLNASVPVVRAMPNTPALINSGATALYANEEVSNTQRDLAESIMRGVGTVVWLKQEAWIDVVTALSGSGPAYFFLLMEILEEVGINLGLPTEIAHMLTLQTAVGAARMALESDLSLQELRRKVTSPRGTTEQAINVFEKNNFRKIVADALLAAKLRAEELAYIADKQIVS